MSDTTLNLGDFQFARFEIPEVIAFGGEQSLVVHALVGGTRIVDVMGEAPAPLEWSGFFVGTNALQRALQLDQMRKAGKPLKLTWSQLTYTVVIRAFRADFVLAYRIPYRITCEVVSDDLAPIAQSVDASPAQLVSDDMSSATTLGGSIGDDTLTGLLAASSTAIAAAGDLNVATSGALNSVLVPLASAQARVGILTSSANGLLGGTIGAGSGAAAALQVSALDSQIGATASLPMLIALAGTLGRMQTNIGAINSGTKSVTVAGGDLLGLASQQYGDTDGWTAIAAANDLSDPRISGIRTLTIPPFTNDTGGVLGA